MDFDDQLEVLDIVFFGGKDLTDGLRAFPLHFGFVCFEFGRAFRFFDERLLQCASVVRCIGAHR